MRRFLYRLTNRLPCRIIDEGGRPYLERYYLCSLGEIRIYIHRFVGSDPDRGLHSHPWTWALSLVLSGWYFEERFSGTDTPVFRRVRWLNCLLGESFHRVVMPADHINSLHGDARGEAIRTSGSIPRECWTLFIHKAQEGGRRWGFLRPLARGGIVRLDAGVRLVQETVETSQVFTPFTYPGGKTSSGRWWKAVPRGRDEPRRRPPS